VVWVKKRFVARWRIIWREKDHPGASLQKRRLAILKVKFLPKDRNIERWICQGGGDLRNWKAETRQVRALEGGSPSIRGWGISNGSKNRG